MATETGTSEALFGFVTAEQSKVPWVAAGMGA
jgi:hypothetical protein